MNDLEKIQKYLIRTGENEKVIWEGFYHFGHGETMDLIELAEKKGKKIIYFYEDDEALQSDNLSYRLE